MLAVSFPAAAFGTNCYVLAPAAGEECVIVDPGIGTEDMVAQVLSEYRLKPAAVLLTHGHVDHVYAVTPVCGSGLTAYIHPDDQYRLADPVGTLDPGLRAMFASQFGEDAWREPERVETVADRQTLELAGLELAVHHAPGHTQGSVLFSIPMVPGGLPDSVDVDRTMLSGDVLFRDSVGRTDLPGGDPAAMQRSLRDVVLAMPDSMLVLPGHGPATTIAREREMNPFLRELAH